MIQDRKFVRARYALYVHVGAISLACDPDTYVNYYGLGRNAAKRAILDDHDRAGVATWTPRDGLSDLEREKIAILENRARFCPVTFGGNIERNKLISEAAIIREAARQQTARGL